MATPEKASLYVENADAPIEFLFNPKAFTLSKTNDWTPDDVPGKNAPDVYFTGGGSGSISFELTFDTTATGTPVTTYTDKLLNAMKVDPTLPTYDEENNRGRPPLVVFHWGDMHSFKAVIDSLTLTFTYFASDGTPLRADASVSLTQFEDEDQWGAQNPTSGTPEPHRVHQFQMGDTLDRLAARYYGDSTKWRLIAQANGVVDPLGVAPGTILVIPKQGVESA